jgi:hypothetical protein
MTNQLTQQQVIALMNEIQDKQIARQPLTAEELKIQNFQFRWGKHHGAKQYLKAIAK